MASPSKGGIIREFTTAMMDRITGRRPATGVRIAALDASTPGIVATDAQMRDAFTGAVQYFPSGMPMRPTAPVEIKGRARDFPPYINQSYYPRSEQGDNAISFKTLIRMASPADGGLDLLRLAIETRKDQMAAQRWLIRGKAKNTDGGTKARKVEQWLTRPDGVHTFRQWMRMLLEDHFVIDAPTIYYGPKTDRPLLELIDGSTIKLLITGDDGRTPLPPLPAYQQVLVGMPAVDYTLEEIGYYPYNLLTRRMYGMSRVEQCLVTIRTALERAVSQLSYYTEGTTPDGFMELPKSFTMEQVQQWTEWFNSELEGQTGERRKIRFVLEGSKYTPTKEAILKDTFDEWLARIVCFNFSISPQALVKEMNRATSETAKEAGQEEGLEPTKLWFKDVMDDALDRTGNGDLEFGWQDEEIVDAQVKATVAVQLRGGPTGTSKPVITLAEQREMMGFPAATPEQLDELDPEPEPVPDPLAGGTNLPNGATKAPEGATKDDVDATKAPDRATKAARGRGGRSLPPLKPNVRLGKRTRRGIQRVAHRALKSQLSAIVAALAARAEKFAKAGGDDLNSLIQDILKDGWDDDAREKLWELLTASSKERAAAAMAQLRPYVDSEAYAEALTQANERSVEWARFRSDNMITEVDDTTKQIVNELTATAIEDGLTNRELADELRDGFGFSADRAERIARTETAFAETAGTLEGYKASGVVGGKEWSADPDACEECAALDGVVVGLDEDFPDGGGDGAPLHPNCLCSVVPVLTDDAQSLIVEADE